MLKRCFAVAVVFVITAVSMSARDLTEECDDIKGVNTVSINQAMLKLVTFPNMGSNPFDLSAVAGKLDKVQIINADVAESTSSVKRVVNSYLKSTPRFERAMKMNDRDQSICLYRRALPENKNEYLVIVEDMREITIVVLVGSVTMSELASFMDF